MTPSKTAGAIDAAPRWATAALVLADGAVFWGKGVGAARHAVGEVCFNTSMTGYQEILTDPSYAGQIITFTFPHIGNVGTNHEDIESDQPGGARRGAARRHHRTCQLAGGQAARRLAEGPQSARHLRRRHAGDHAACPRRRCAQRRGRPCPGRQVRHSRAAQERAGLAGPRRHGPRHRGRLPADLQLGRDQWALGQGYGKLAKPKYHVVAVDYGAKRNILRCLASTGCRVTVVPATATAEDILRHKPDGVFLSNGPGDPAATGDYACRRSRAARQEGAVVRHLPRPSDAGAGPGRQDAQDGTRPSRRQPSGQGPDHRQGRDHQPEPRLLRRCPSRCPRTSRSPTSRCSTAPTRACAAPTSRSSRCSTIPRLRRARRTATICSTVSSS